jgi:hypothetical protein
MVRKTDNNRKERKEISHKRKFQLSNQPTKQAEKQKYML